MIVPSIDIMDGQAVQLVGGEKKAIDAGDPMPIAERFAVAGEIAVIDLDAALGRGDNTKIIERLIRRYPCRVGGGIRDAEAAMRWLDAGATQVIMGTAARPEILDALPRERVVAALDTKHGEVVVEGWQKGTGRSGLERIGELRDHVGGFLVTMVEREGRMQGIDMDNVARVVEAAGDVEVTVAGGVTTPEEIAQIDRLGADAQVGMAIYSGRMDLADAMMAPAISDRPDGLWPTVVADEMGRALGLVYSSLDSVREAVKTRRGVYHSRKRGPWVKGETSGATQELLKIEMDCDRDALKFTVRQAGSGFCHVGTWTCFGDDGGIGRLIRTLKGRRESAPEGSYTRKLFDDPALLRGKLLEEAAELADAEIDGVAHETADVIFFALTAMVRAGVEIDEVQRQLDLRSLKVVRRPGDAKPVPEVGS